MSEHIKTGEEIYYEILEYEEKDNDHEWMNLKFVDLSWLKEQIDKQTNDIANKPISVYDTGAWDMLRWLSKLLEES